ncbi:hypothetical protein Vadar_028790 [Vaccinium darrowii]|uniref:Uncharacterized protein n=1 Tax=Vaccinium darrowii TaxID=229202 RepID=A0ACB7YGJ2_9ERIC|nr:hypothetical protein Vadar_028790 [Vaccinium darrowii]
MEENKEKNKPWLSVPQFGDWEQQGEMPDYSMDFTKIREMRKQHKRDVSRASIGNEEDLTSSTTSAAAKTTGHHSDHRHYQQNNHSPTTRRSIFSYFNCFAKA